MFTVSWSKRRKEVEFLIDGLSVKKEVYEDWPKPVGDIVVGTWPRDLPSHRFVAPVGPILFTRNKVSASTINELFEATSGGLEV